MSPLVLILVSGMIGVVIGLAAGRYLDPLRKTGQQKATDYKKIQDEVNTLKTQTGEHFRQTAASVMQLREQTKQLHSQLALDAARIAGLNLEGTEDLHEPALLARLGSGEATLPPRDYAPKMDDTLGTLSEEYGLRDDDYAPQSKSTVAIAKTK